MKQCELCEGRREVRKNGDPKGRPGDDEELMDCPDCHGDGEVLTPGYCLCPLCDENGVMWVKCEPCKGEGYLTFPNGLTDMCGKCLSAGEVKAGKCTFCDGAREIPKALKELYEADTAVRLHSPDWDGVLTAEHEGSTCYSLSAYYRNRKTLQATTRAVFVTRFPEGVQVALSPVEHVTMTTEGISFFNGFEYGYGGEGPHGLATILNDLMPKYWATPDAASRYVASQTDVKFTLFMPRLPQRKPEEL